MPPTRPCSDPIGTTSSTDFPQDEMQIRIARDETIFFVSSSGHCNLDCSYCVVSPIAKHETTLNYDDLRFVLDQVRGKAFFIFSGKGDFFAGYRKDERLLARLLSHDNVGVALDINGVVIHCFEDLDAEQLARIRHVNLTFHYRQLRNHKALKLWQQNALTLLRRKDGADFFLNTVLSSPESGWWDEALGWYEENVYAVHAKKIILIKDVNRPFTADDERTIERLQQRFGHLIQSLRRGDFDQPFEPFDYVTCPAGQQYFRIWNDGRVEACPNVEALRQAGNVKQRTFVPRADPFDCHNARHCDCFHIASAGKMTFHRQQRTPLIS